MAERITIPVDTPNRTGMQTAVWLPEGEPRAVIQIFHGMAEHIDRYDRTARELTQRGYAVAGANHKGHGPETPDDQLGYFYAEDGWRKIVEDGHAVSERLRQELPGRPLILLGHSMGSFMARDYITRYPGEPDALILSGTGWYAASLCQAGRLLARLCKPDAPAPRVDQLAFAANNKSFQPARTPYDWLTRDNAEVDKYIADPRCGFIFTGRGYYDMFTGLLGLRDVSKLKHVNTDLPVCFISGDSDPVGQMSKGVLMVAREFRDAGLTDVTVKLYNHARHELLNEMNRDEVMADLCAWLEKCLRKIA